MGSDPNGESVISPNLDDASPTATNSQKAQSRLRIEHRRGTNVGVGVVGWWLGEGSLPAVVAAELGPMENVKTVRTAGRNFHVNISTRYLGVYLGRSRRGGAPGVATRLEDSSTVTLTHKEG